MRSCQEAERSIIKTYRKGIWSRFIKGIKDYELIKANDKIAVCISGGKDSMLLAKCIQELIRHSQIPFTAHRHKDVPAAFWHISNKVTDPALLHNQRFLL